MDKVAQLSSKERAELFSETAIKKGVSPAIIEKDFWVCWVLQKIFSEESLKNKLLFKGGTSLSKVFHVIERFSEDIDLVLNWNLICDEDPRAQRSKTKQGKFNQEINNTAQKYIAATLLPIFSDCCLPYCTVEVDSVDGYCLNVVYERSFKDQYIRPEVRLEIGPLASWLPHNAFSITPYAADYFPEVFYNAKVEVCAIEGQRTFWEKATILHHETYRLNINAQPKRYSRHYYDLALLAKTDIKIRALSDLTLLADVVAFKNHFYSQGWARYDLAVPGTFRLIPSDDMKQNLSKDYVDMQDMIFGEKISFEEILKILKVLEDEINTLVVDVGRK